MEPPLPPWSLDGASIASLPPLLPWGLHFFRGASTEGAYGGYVPPVEPYGLRCSHYFHGGCLASTKAPCNILRQVQGALV